MGPQGGQLLFWGRWATVQQEEEGAGEEEKAGVPGWVVEIGHLAASGQPDILTARFGPDIVSPVPEEAPCGW